MRNIRFFRSIIQAHSIAFFISTSRSSGLCRLHTKSNAADADSMRGHLLIIEKGMI